MHDAPKLSDRKARLLAALVAQYIRTGEPVGSESLSAAAGLTVSSATIRNELAALEEMGYLTQPHASAGRVPTDLGYRHYVDSLPARMRLGESDKRAIVGFFDEALADVDEILRGTTQLLSRLTHHASVALARNAREGSVVRLEVVNLNSGALLLIVFDSGQVERRFLELPEGVGTEEAERVASRLGEAVRGSSLSDVRATAGLRARAAQDESERRLLGQIEATVASIAEAVQAEHVLYGGVANIVAERAFEHRETLRQVYEALERETEILELLRQTAVATEPVRVTIGRENPVSGMWEATMIAAPFGIGGIGSNALGTIGVVGPTRMDYASAISAVRAVADRLSAAVRALEQ
jgi:heat-inducible transcriptional repressor